MVLHKTIEMTMIITVIDIIAMNIILDDIDIRYYIKVTSHSLHLVYHV